jgi:hypothetical protein
MANTTIKVPRAHLIMGLCLPLAVLLGYLLAEPLDSSAIAVVVMVLALFSVPALMKWHHPLLILCWNAALVPVFLPGAPPLWLLMALLSFLFAMLNRAVDPFRRFIWVPSLVWPVLALLVVVAGTAFLTGGIGLRTFGAERQGGKGYTFIFGAAAGFFALCSQHIPVKRAGAYVAMFFLPSLMALIPDLADWAGPHFYFMFDFIAPNGQVGQFASGSGVDLSMTRPTGPAAALAGPAAYLLARHGVRGVLDLSRPFRLTILCMTVAASMISGYRSSLLLLGLTWGCAFWLEGLWRTRLMPILSAVGLIAAILLVSQAEKLPFSAQRSLAFLPIPIDPAAKESAAGTTEWRVEMWKLVLPQVPQYFWKGKGYNLDPNDLFLAQQSAVRGIDTAQGVTGTMVAGDYHNGPLSVIIPFGIYGALAFLWFLSASISYLYRCMRFGDPALRKINTFLLASFIAKSILFFIVFGAFSNDLPVFLGLLGFGVCLNGRPGMPAVVEDTEESLNPFPETVY